MNMATWYEVRATRGHSQLDNTATGTMNGARSAVRRFDALYDRVVIDVRQHLRGTRKFRVLRGLGIDKTEGKT